MFFLIEVMYVFFIFVVLFGLLVEFVSVGGLYVVVVGDWF